ncbi:hypothetical protein [Pseudomonas syringae group genomosp. 3]|uniref:hypothetical protein n=1 Tax=Pseudomonas syringae group genomosp. 3 TaxID=251701 RepID=UPI0011C48C8D|nr:hypothetical protein [Pseudomonas syringae group genomosp. 3]
MNSQSTNKNNIKAISTTVVVSSLLLISILFPNVSVADSSGRQEMMCLVSELVLEILLSDDDKITTTRGHNEMDN